MEIPVNTIADVISYWVDYNNCETTPTTTTLPDVDVSDGSTVEHSVYEDGDNGITTEHMKVIGGGHTWPGSVINSGEQIKILMPQWKSGCSFQDMISMDYYQLMTLKITK
jgi:poly(3-hydroxybutyrate) depolymerase